MTLFATFKQRVRLIHVGIEEEEARWCDANRAGAGQAMDEAGEVLVRHGLGVAVDSKHALELV